MSDLALLSYFFDPVVRAPMIASMLMCFSSGLIGSLVFLRKESLVGEVLSHATYPGIALGGLIGVAFAFPSAILLGAFFFALLGAVMMHLMVCKGGVSRDSAMTFTLAAFFGWGVTLASRLQFTHSSLYRQVQLYLYGQVATMGDRHIVIYALLALIVLALLLLFYKEIKLVIFDTTQAEVLGLKTRWIDFMILALVALAVVVGMRAVGVVLMSGMLIAPAVCARQMTRRMSRMLALAAVTGIVSAFLGNVLSMQIGEREGLSLPTGPMIVLTASFFALLSLLFAPEKGVLWTAIRARIFQKQCRAENILKTLWRRANLSSEEIASYHGKYQLGSTLKALQGAGWIAHAEGKYTLTGDGKKRAQRIVRLHRLWEVYLVSYLGAPAQRVHKSAEEIEHIMTPELEEELLVLIGDASIDPHSQPIPKEPL